VSCEYPIVSVTSVRLGSLNVALTFPLIVGLTLIITCPPHFETRPPQARDCCLALALPRHARTLHERPNFEVHKPFFFLHPHTSTSTTTITTSPLSHTITMPDLSRLWRKHRHIAPPGTLGVAASSYSFGKCGVQTPVPLCLSVSALELQIRLLLSLLSYSGAPKRCTRLRDRRHQHHLAVPARSTPIVRTCSGEISSCACAVGLFESENGRYVNLPLPPRSLALPRSVLTTLAEVIREKVQDGLTGETKEMQYTQCKIVGNGSFGEAVALRRRCCHQARAAGQALQGVYHQWPRAMLPVTFTNSPQNRELQVMRIVRHPNIVPVW